jgi:hypothetical protein
MNDIRPLVPSDIPAARTEQQRRAAREFIHAAKWLAVGGVGAEATAKANRANDRVLQVVKAAVAAGSLDNGDSALAAFADVSGAWLAALRTAGVFDAMVADMIPAPMLQRFAASTTTYAWGEVLEGAGIPLARLTLDGADPLLPRRVAAIMVITAELARSSDAAALIDRELRAGVVAGVDQAFLAALLAAVTPAASAGNRVDDIDTLLAAVPLGAGSRPYFIFAQDVGKRLATERSSDVRLWPEMTPLGGSIVGVPALVTDRLAAGTGLLVDAAAIAANAGEVLLDISSAASVEMSDTPTVASIAGSPPAPVPVNLVSMFQTNGRALRVQRYYAFRVLRGAAFAAVEGMFGGSP